MLKLIHASDFHLDSPFSGLGPEQAALRRGELAWTLTRGRVLSFLRTGAEGSVLAAVNAGERPEPIDLPWPARDWMTGAALEQGEQTLPPMTGWLLTPRPEGA